VPGEHDTLDETPGKAYRERALVQAATAGGFDAGSVHFPTSSMSQLRPGGFGSLGADQITWPRNNVALYPQADRHVRAHHLDRLRDQGGAPRMPRALAILNRFGSVTVLNGTFIRL
jgi:hypothetical protein